MIGRCDACGTEVNFPPSRFKLGHIYCGKSCHDSVRHLRPTKESTKAKLKAIREARSERLVPNVSCHTCGKAVYKPQCEIRGVKHNYCSKTCRLNAPHQEHVVPNAACARCGIPIRIRAGRNDRPRFCSMACNAGAKRKPFIVKNGYRLVLRQGHHRADHYGYVREHLLVMEDMIGRPLKQREVVHHNNGDKQDNQPSNLTLFASNREHLRVAHTRSDPNPGALAV